MAKEDRACEACGAAFTPRTNAQRFCSRRCSGSASSPRKTPQERRCIAEGCTKDKVFAATGLCHKHQYRLEHYGDPLAEPKRKRRNSTPIDLKVDWEQVDASTWWEKSPTYCPQGHEYTEANTATRKGRDGVTRRICRECARAASLRYKRGEKPDRTATCEKCGVVWEASKYGLIPKLCKSCMLQRHRAKSRLNSARRRGQTPKGPTYVCTACGVVSETPATSGMPPKLCDACQKINSLKSKRKLWTKKVLDRYSIDEARFLALAEAQGNVCAVCGTSDPGGSVRRWHVDHDHSCCGPGVSCGKCIRGLLCSRCNTAIGLLDDNTARLEAALAYLTDPPARRID